METDIIHFGDRRYVGRGLSQRQHVLRLLLSRLRTAAASSSCVPVGSRSILHVVSRACRRWSWLRNGRRWMGACVGKLLMDRLDFWMEIRYAALASVLRKEDN